MHSLTMFVIYLLVLVVHPDFPKIFWTYLESGLDGHPFVRMFDDHHRKMIQKDGWEVRTLNKTSVLTYLKQIPLFSQQQYNQIDKTMTPSARQDYIRCLLISYYSGVYFDFTSLVIQDLAWLKFESLRNNMDVQNKYGDSPDVLLFTFSTYSTNSTYNDPQTNQKYLLVPGYQFWFIAAVPKAPFLVQFCPKLIEAYLNGCTSKQGYERYIQKIIEEEQIQIGSELKNNHSLASVTLMQIQIQRKQKILDKISRDNNSTLHLAVWHYKLWHISSLDGPVALYNSYGAVQICYFAIYNLQQLRKIFRIKIKYFVKITQDSKEYILDYFVALIPIYDIKRQAKCYLYKESYCTVFDHSFLYQNFVKDNQYENLVNVKSKIWLTQRVTLMLDGQQQNPFFFAKMVKITMVLILVTIVFIFLIKRESKIYRNQMNLILENKTQKESTFNQKSQTIISQLKIEN